MPLCSTKTINKLLFPTSCLLDGSPCWDGSVTSRSHHWHSSSLCQCVWLDRADVKILKLIVILPEKRQSGNCIHLLCFLASLLMCCRSVKGPFLTLFLKMVSLTPLFFLICCHSLVSPPGACEGTLACSTCHLIFDRDTFQKLDAISDEELDMLDLAYGLTDT